MAYTSMPAFFLRLNATLTSLNLGWNGLGPKGGAQLAAALMGNITLTSLILDGNCLCGVYQEFNERTQSIEEMGTYTTAGFTELCEALMCSAVTSLRCVGAARARLSASARKHTRAGVVCDITTCLSSLCHSLYRNDICDNGVKSLAAVLKNTKITRLKCATLIAPPCIFIARPMTVLVLLSASQTTSWGR